MELTTLIAWYPQRRQTANQINLILSHHQQAKVEAVHTPRVLTRPQTYDGYSALHTQHSMCLNVESWVWKDSRSMLWVPHSNTLSVECGVLSIRHKFGGRPFFCVSKICGSWLLNHIERHLESIIHYTYRLSLRLLTVLNWCHFDLVQTLESYPYSYW